MRHVASLVDYCSAHSTIDNIKVIDLHFLPPNAISKLHPLGQGVIRVLKAKEHRSIFRKHIRSLGKTKSLPQILLLGGMQMLCLAGNVSNPRTIINCFKWGTSSGNQGRAVVDEDDSLKQLQNETDLLTGSHLEIIPGEMTVKGFVVADEEVLTTEPFTDEVIVGELRSIHQAVAEVFIICQPEKCHAFRLQSDLV